MKKLILIFAFIIILLGVFPAFAQQINGQRFTFKNGNTEWSDTIYKKLLTKKMAKEGQKPVLLGIRYKSDKVVDEGKWYLIEITNKSKSEKVKFNVATSHSQEIFPIKLGPGETKVIKKLYYKNTNLNASGHQDDDYDYLISPYEEILQNRE
jgi:hypothetical protein